MNVFAFIKLKHWKYYLCNIEYKSRNIFVCGLYYETRHLEIYSTIKSVSFSQTRSLHPNVLPYTGGATGLFLLPLTPI